MKLRTEDLGPLARGAAVLGTGGGGDPHIGRLLAQEALREHGPVEIVAVGDLPDDACVLPVAMTASTGWPRPELPPSRPSATPADVRTILTSSARPFPAGSACAAGQSLAGMCGAGLLDAAAAVLATIWLSRRVLS